MSARRTLLVYADAAHTRTLSYQSGWVKHFLRDPRFDCTPLNLLSRTSGLRTQARLALGLGRFDAIVVLHSAFSNACYLRGGLLRAVARVRAPKAYFIGNEYKLMPEKMAFAETLGVDLLVTMNPDPEAQAMYRERLGCAVACIPSAGLDAEVFYPRTARGRRPVDIGYRGDDAPWYLGHREREEVVEWARRTSETHGLHVDVSLDPADRLAGPAWPDFLDRCRSQVGTEAGADYFELDGSTRERVLAFRAQNSEATFDDVREVVFAGRQPRARGRMISGRNVEAAATKTVQILLEGSYSGYFEPGVHYIPLRKDFSNGDEAIATMQDDNAAARIADAAYEVAQAEFRYQVLLDRFAVVFDEAR